MKTLWLVVGAAAAAGTGLAALRLFGFFDAEGPPPVQTGLKPTLFGIEFDRFAVAELAAVLFSLAITAVAFQKAFAKPDQKAYAKPKK